MDEEKLTEANVVRGFEDSKRRNDEVGAQIAELRVQVGETFSKLEKMFAENRAEADKRSAELVARIAEITKNINGISDSNGMFAEELFFNTLSEKKEFAGIHFDTVEDDVGYSLKFFGGKRLKDQFDIVMANAASVAIIETKYRARKADVETLAGRKVENFKTLFPEYKDFKIYLGLGALAFEDDVVDEARKYGVGLLKQVGDTVEYATDWEVKAY